MIEPVPRSVVEAFHQAYADRDAKRIAEFLDDDVQWSINGPVDLLHFCGSRRGKAAVIDLIFRLLPETFRGSRFATEARLVDGDRAATLSRLNATKSDNGRMVSYRVAQFVRFRDCKVIEYVSIIDSFDAVEQVLGHTLPVHDGIPPLEGNLIAI
jgi:ketosteroid isomerase-like protein